MYSDCTICCVYKARITATFLSIQFTGKWRFLCDRGKFPWLANVNVLLYRADGGQLSNNNSDGEQLTDMAWRWAFLLVVVRRAAGSAARLSSILSWSRTPATRSAAPAVHRMSPGDRGPRYGHLNQLTVTTRIAERRFGWTRREWLKVMTSRPRRVAAGDDCMAVGSIAAGHQSRTFSSASLVVSQWIQLICTVSNYNYRRLMFARAERQQNV